MGFKTAWYRKWLGAFFTNKWLFSWMSARVCFKIAQFRKWLRTLFTSKWLLSWMASKVDFQMIFLWKWHGHHQPIINITFTQPLFLYVCMVASSEERVASKWYRCSIAGRFLSCGIIKWQLEFLFIFDNTSREENLLGFPSL